MQYVDPVVIQVAETKLVADGVDALQMELGVPGWTTDAKTDAEELIEIAGRLCYKSFGTELNANLTKVREGNQSYIGNILNVKHGSVLEHSSVSFALLNVSRIFTHELVRHRQGTAFSQESGRFVRIDKIRMPKSEVMTEAFFAKHICVGTNSDIDPKESLHVTQEGIHNAMDGIEELIQGLNSLIHDNMPFSIKKRITSFIRRFSPNGQVNDIMLTMNHRAARYLIQQRTAEGAEEEIRLVFGIIATQLALRYPAIYQDMETRSAADSSTPVFTFKNEKV